MPRRYRPEKRKIEPDVRYHNVQVQSFINRVMKRGKKSTATRLVYDTFDLIEKDSKKDPLEVFLQAIKNVSPVMEVKPRRVGGATYQVPMEVTSDRQFALATRWILAAARGRSGRVPGAEAARGIPASGLPGSRGSAGHCEAEPG